MWFAHLIIPPRLTFVPTQMEKWNEMESKNSPCNINEKVEFAWYNLRCLFTCLTYNTTLNYALWIIPSLVVKWADASAICSFTLTGTTIIVLFYQHTVSLWMHCLKSCLDFTSSSLPHNSEIICYICLWIIYMLIWMILYIHTFCSLSVLMDISCTFMQELTLSSHFIRCIFLVLSM